MALVSIIIPVYNTERFIAKAIESVLMQSFHDLELVIVDDASTDRTFEICQQYAQKDTRIKLIKNPHNLGMMPNWNHALNFVTGKYWGKLDADDWWDKDFVKDCVKILDENEDVGMVCGRYVLVDEHDKVIQGSAYFLPNEFANSSTDFVWKVKRGVYGMFQPSLAQQGNGLIRKEVIERFGDYKLLPAGDTEFYFRIGAHYKISFIDKLVHFHRVWPENFTRREVLNSGRFEKNMYDVRQEIFDYYFSKCIISRKEHKKFSRQNQFEYNKYLLVKTRKEQDLKNFLKIFFQSFGMAPFRFLVFYAGRIFEKFTI